MVHDFFHKTCQKPNGSVVLTQTATQSVLADSEQLQAVWGQHERGVSQLFAFPL